MSPPPAQRNVAQGILQNDGDGTRSMRRSQFLWSDRPSAKTKGHTMFGSAQSLDVLQNYDLGVMKDYPQDWLKADSLLRVPKVVILSVLANWTLLWKQGVWIFPYDTIGINIGVGTRGPTHYWHMLQYNEDPDLGLVNPNIRYRRIVCRWVNPWWNWVQQLGQAFDQAKKTLESGPDPVFCVVPHWVPRAADFQWRTVPSFPHLIDHNPNNVPQNPKNHTGDEGVFYTDFGPIDSSFPVPLDTGNQLDFHFGGVPCLLSGPPHFGCNVLHLYIGHFAWRTDPGADLYSYTGWPMVPEGQAYGDVFLGTYLRADLPAFDGQRREWRPPGLMADLGFGPDGSGDNLYHDQGYDAICRVQASSYAQNAAKYRNLVTHIFTFPDITPPDFDAGAINADRASLHSFQFIFPYSYAYMNATFGGPDLFYYPYPGDDPTDGFAAKRVLDPPHDEFLDAVGVQAPPIIGQVQKYYAGIEPGTRQLFRAMVKDINLPQYVQYKGDCSSLLTADAIVKYVKAYFKDQSPS
jgi:hypothetical protein